MRSESIAGLMKALCQAQRQFPPILKQQENPYYQSKYADLSEYVEATRKPLADVGIAVTQDVETEFLAEPLAFELVDIDKFGKMKTLKGSTRIVVAVTTKLHLGDEFDGSTLRFPVVDPRPQTICSASTYGRRYGFAAKVFAAAEEDDGNEASGAGRELTKPEDRKKYIEDKTKRLQDEIDEARKAPSPRDSPKDKIRQQVEAYVKDRDEPGAKARFKQQLEASLEDMAEAKGGMEPEPQTPAKDPGLISDAQKAMIFTIAKKRGLSEADVFDILGSFGFEHLSEMPKSKVSIFLDEMDPDFRFHHKQAN